MCILGCGVARAHPLINIAKKLVEINIVFIYIKKKKRKHIKMKPATPTVSFLAIVLTIVYSNSAHGAKIYNNANTEVATSLPRVSADLITLEFYSALSTVKSAKTELQNKLHNFLEHLQRNLTTSTVFNSNVVNATDDKLQKVINLWGYFKDAATKVENFIKQAEIFFETSKNESYALVQKLRQETAIQRSLSDQVKEQLTNYFAEIEFLHILFCEIIDEVLEYAIDELHTTQKTFQRYKDIQQDVIYNWKFNASDVCCTHYINFLHQWSAHIFKCTAGDELQTVYDVYAVTEYTIRHVLQQIEFRLSRLFRCFKFGQLQLRCRFLMSPEGDFEKLRSKLDELQVYFDVKAKHGLVSPNRHRHQRRYSDKLSFQVTQAPQNNENSTHLIYDKCIPYGFPDMQMMSNLKICFNFNQLN